MKTCLQCANMLCLQDAALISRVPLAHTLLVQYKLVLLIGNNAAAQSFGCQPMLIGPAKRMLLNECADLPVSVPISSHLFNQHGLHRDCVLNNCPTSVNNEQVFLALSLWQLRYGNEVGLVL